MDTEIQNNSTELNIDSNVGVLSFKDIVIYLLFFSVVCLLISFPGFLLRVLSPSFGNQSIDDISARLLADYILLKYCILILFFWISSAVIAEKILQKGMSANPHTLKNFIKYFLLYFLGLTILVNVSFQIVDGLFIYLARQADRCSDWCGIELYIFPFASLPFIAGFTLARYFIFVSFEPGFFSKTLLGFTKKNKTSNYDSVVYLDNYSCSGYH